MPDDDDAMQHGSEGNPRDVTSLTTLLFVWGRNRKPITCSFFQTMCVPGSSLPSRPFAFPSLSLSLSSSSIALGAAAAICCRSLLLLLLLLLLLRIVAAAAARAASASAAIVLLQFASLRQLELNFAHHGSNHCWQL